GVAAGPVGIRDLRRPRARRARNGRGSTGTCRNHARRPDLRSRQAARQGVLVNFWATWCAPCRKEMPTLDAFYRRYRGQGFEMIGVSVDIARDSALMRKASSAVAYPTGM